MKKNEFDESAHHLHYEKHVVKFLQGGEPNTYSVRKDNKFKTQT
jgi:hypothetical protein